MLLLLVACKPPARPLPVELATLAEGQVVEGFRVDAVYVDGADRPIGARLEHVHTGMPLRLLEWDTVPQAFLWVNTVPSSDRGEPHTQEHLLLGKGNRGRAVATLDDLSLVESTAYTEQHRTVYQFRTTAGPDVFFRVFDARLQALLAPDYLDEEVRREVHHWGVVEADGGLALEEKGTVFNEMDSSTQRPGWVLWSQVPKDLYGPDHPHAFESGGTPDGLRQLGPEHIRAFHAATYQLPNMGMIAFLPDDVPFASALDRFDATLVRLQPEPTPADRTFVTEDDLPPPRTAADRAVRELRYPLGDAAGDTTFLVVWPPGRELALREELLLSLLLSGLAGAENTNLYKAVVDSRTRERDLGATGIGAWVGDDPGHPVYVNVGGLSATGFDPEDVGWLAGRIRRELADLAARPAGDPALVDLRRRLQAELVSWRRAMRDSMTGPPDFGTRGTGSGWYDHLVDLDREGGFRRPLLLEPQLAWVEAELAREDNPWSGHLANWGLLDAEPFVYVNRPDPARLEALEAAKQARITVELAALEARYGKTGQEALAAFRADADRATAELERARKAPDARFLEAPPLLPDEGLDWERREVLGVPWVVGRFDALEGAKIGLALDLTRLPPERYVWLRILPRLLTDVGVVVDGVPISNDDVLERLQLEVLDASASTSSNADTGRAELTFTAAGTDPAETRAALRWVRTFLTSPDWRPENLPRIRDVVDEALDSTRRRMLGPEERWTSNPPSAWRHQDDPLQLHLWSFLTNEHDLLRLRFRLLDPDPAASAALGRLAAAPAKLDRAGLQALLADLAAGKGGAIVPDPVPPAVREAAEDLERTVGALPDATLPEDFAFLCRALAAELAVPPAQALAELDALRKDLLRRGGARIYTAGGAMLDTLDADLQEWVALLAEGRPEPVADTAVAPLRARVTARGGHGDAVHVGLFDPNRRSGVAIVTAPLTKVTDLDEDHVLDDLSLRVLSGGGAHSLFMRTWGAGLAYSNGSAIDESSGRMRWSAERCPLLPQTAAFVLDEVRAATVDEAVAEYALAGLFWSRADGSYEGRTAALATDLADGEPPEVVKAFREAVLAQRARPDLAEELARRVPGVYGRLLPGLDPPTAAVEGAETFAIGDRAQLDAWAAWLREVEGEAATFEVLYPRDFWLPDAGG